MTRRGALAGLGVLVLVSLLAGCGSYTRRDFDARANAVCSSALRTLRALPAGGGVVAYLHAAIPVITRESHELSSLRRPPLAPRQAELLRRFLASVAASPAEFRGLARAEATGSPSAVAAAAAPLRAAQTVSLSAALGLTDCGAPGATVR